MNECIFCRIARAEVPSSVVYENDEVIAFDDVAPQAPVHVLIIPRVHYEHLGWDVPDDVLAALLGAAHRVAEIKGIADAGYRVIINTGVDGGQVVKHLHVHVVGGARMAHGMVRLAEGS